MATQKTFIAFIDLLGTKFRAQNNPDEYFESVKQFQQIVANTSGVLGQTGVIYVFSDCAYVQSANLEKLVAYLREVRSSLLSSNFYLKGSLSEGDLEAKPAHGSDLIDDPAIRNSRERSVKGHSFGRSVAELFSAHENLKGIGITVDGKLRELALSRGYSVVSCHLPDEIGRNVRTFLDIRFDEDELEQEFLENSMKDLFRASTRSRKLAKYYVSLMVSWIRSSDFSAMDLDALGYDVPSSRTPPIYNVIMRSMFGRSLAGLVGIEFVYLVLLDKIYSDCGEGNVARSVAEYIARRRKLVSSLEYVPSEILSPENRDRFERFLAKSLVIPRKSPVPRTAIKL